MTPKKKKILRRNAEPETRFERVVLDLAGAAADLADVADESPKWVQVANAGDYRGYVGGRFVFDDVVFDQIIANLHAHPSYVAGADGVGTADVIPWDFNHASEAFAGDVAVDGTPAQGWVRELQKRQGPDGPQLFALTNWLEPAKSYVRDGKYKWASVVVGFDCRDPKTNTNVGAIMASVALTNQPFIEGMMPLVASKQGAAMSGKQQGQRVAGQYWYGDKATSAEDALRLIRNMLELPQTADLGVILGQLANLQAWSLGTSSPPLGVDLDQLVSNLRCILNLPALTSTAEVFAESNKLLSSLLDQQAAEENESTPAVPAAPPPNDVPPPSAAQAERTMSFKLIASKLQVLETEAAVVERVDGLLALRTSLAKHIGVPANANDSVLLEAAAGGADIRTKLGAILKALGVEDSDGAVDKVAGLMKQAKDLEAAMPELSELREAAAKTEEKSADADVEKVMNSKGIDDAGVREALALSRKTNKAAFLTRYADVLAAAPAAAPAAQTPGTAYLTTNLTGGTGGAERKVTNNSDGSVNLSAPTVDKSGKPPGGKVRVDLSKTAGANRTAKAMNYVAEQAGGDKLTYDQKFEAARKLLKECEIVDAPGAAA